MKILQGKSNSNGIAIGKLFHLKQKICPVQNNAENCAVGTPLSAQDIQSELEKFEQAKEMMKQMKNGGNGFPKMPKQITKIKYR